MEQWLDTTTGEPLPFVKLRIVSRSRTESVDAQHHRHGGWASRGNGPAQMG
jgi:hypothetical protein